MDYGKYRQKYIDIITTCNVKNDISQWNKIREGKKIILKNIQLSDLNLRKINFRDINLDGSNLRNVDLSYANLENASLKRVNLEGVDLSNANLRNADLEGAKLKDSKLSETNLANADITKANFIRVNLINANLNRANLSNSKIIESNLDDAVLQDSNCYETRFVNSDLKGANFENADLESANLKSCICISTNFRNAHFVSANFKMATLNHADFQNSNLTDAVLHKANFISVNLKGANFDGTDLRGALLKMAIGDGSTIFTKCKIDRQTNCTGFNINSIRIDTGIKQLLEYNIRKKNWEHWYEDHPFYKFPLIIFWFISDYGRSATRIITFFFFISLLFADFYFIIGTYEYYKSPSKLYQEDQKVGSRTKFVSKQKNSQTPGVINQLFFYDKEMKNYSPPSLKIYLRSFYFSIVTMTTLGFGDMFAKTNSYLGYVALIIHVIFGYFLLGALITRLAIVFTSGGPSHSFEKDKNRVMRSFRLYI